ncbi:hypothetical protein RRG08_010441 [Elysia crispata]|nr:hypothetical protein RRG08_010441 [Elysia crispata]
MVILGYLTLSGQEELINTELYKIIAKILPYWPKETKSIFNKFKDVTLPYPGWTRNDTLVNPHRMSLEELVGVFSSFYSVLAYQQDHPEEHFLEQIETSLRDAHRQVFGQQEEIVFDLTWETFLLIGRKPLQ